MTVLLVDWLGRGGIAHTSQAWVAELEAAGHEVAVVTRPGRELTSTAAVQVAAAPGKLRAHKAVVDAATRAIAHHRPSAVVIQNYLVPALERAVYRAAARVGARTILVVHDHRMHSRLAGSHVLLGDCIKAADVVVTHTRFVASTVGRDGGGREVLVVPHPVPLGMIGRQPDGGRVAGTGSPPLAVHFGTLKRGYKGTSTVVELAGSGVDGWRFALLGNGAPASLAGVRTVPGYVDTETLVATVAESQATLLPYTHASQSGAVVLAQVLGSAVVASAVGGIPEQIEHGETGLLLLAGAPLAAWRGALEEISDPDRRRTLTSTAEKRIWDGHAEFGSVVRGLAA